MTELRTCAHAEIARAVAVEDGVRLEVVVVDGTVLDGGATGAAIRLIRVIGIPAVVGNSQRPNFIFWRNFAMIEPRTCALIFFTRDSLIISESPPL